jgi:hypothetical protein
MSTSTANTLLLLLLPLMNIERKLSADGYYGQRDCKELPHGMGVVLAPNGEVMNCQCGRWKHGRLEEPMWVWRGFLSTTAPLSEQASVADAIGPYDDVFYGPTNGTHCTPHGTGKTYWADGTLQSEGIFVHGCLEGVAMFRSPFGEVYTGNFAYNLPYGRGCNAFPDGSTYEGEFENGSEHGIGRATFPSASGCHEGQWVNGRLDGLGWLKIGPLQQVGLWTHNKFVRACAIPRGVLPSDSKLLSVAAHAAGPRIVILPQGGYYSGSVNRARQRHGEGTTFADDGTLMQRGLWEKDVFVCTRDMSNKAVNVTVAVALDVKGEEEEEEEEENKGKGLAKEDGDLKKMNARDALDCVICLDRSRDCLIDCVHFCLCFACAKIQQRCPLCRAAITQRIQKHIVLS